MFVPTLFSTLRGYDRTQFAAAVAGVIVVIVALPLAIVPSPDFALARAHELLHIEGT